MCGSISKSIRYYSDNKEEVKEKCKKDFVYVLPPSLGMYSSCIVNWGKYYRSSNIWFCGNEMKDKKVIIDLDPSNPSESCDILQLLSILYRKDPKNVIIIIPFLEQATQDRIEYKEGYESLAQIDTIAKLLGKHTVYTFDLHAEQSQFAFYDLRCFSLVKELYNRYCMYNSSFTVAFPDEGSAKRFGKLLNVKNPIIFSKIREGEKRFVKPNRILKSDETEIVIIDDLVRSGGTMYEVANYLLNNGAKKVDALFAHAPFEPSASINLRLFRDIWTTDTCPQNLPREWIKIHIFDFVTSLL
jgi:phosphoribosylpyrophosphate synthetase